MTHKKFLVDQLKDATELAIEATLQVTDIVEKVHHTIAGGPEIFGKPLEAMIKLLTAPTYGAIRGVTQVVGTSLNLAVSTFEPLLDFPGAERGSFLAALNGVFGDYLAETGNSLAIDMTLCSKGQSLSVTTDALREEFPKGGRLLILLHGSCLDESSWSRNGLDYGAALESDLDFIPLYFRYNSGLHISQNGRAVAEILEQLVKSWPSPVEELVLMGHSMGGLVARSACIIGEMLGHTWRHKLKVLVTLGTPHQGSPLERGGHWVDVGLGISRYSAPFAQLGKLRSAGVTDLRYGNVMDVHWEGLDRFAKGGDPRENISLPKGVACFAIAGTTTSSFTQTPASDRLVPVDSALGRHEDPLRALDFEESHQWIAWGTNHLGLLRSKDVYAKILAWLKQELV